MSFIRGIGFGNGIKVDIPDKKTVFVKGRSKERLLYVTESLLARDMSGYYGELDGHSFDLSSDAYLLFDEGSIRSVDKVVQIVGVVPNVHVIRYAGHGTSFRSFHLSNSLSTYSQVYTDMRKYSKVIDDAQWFRLVSMVNNLLGFEFVLLEDFELKFNPMESMPVSVDGQKLVYMLMAECYLTPPGYKRAVLLSDIPYLDKELELQFIKRLGAIAGHGLILSTEGVEFSDIAVEKSMAILTV